MLRTLSSLIVTLTLVAMIIWLGKLVVSSRHQVNNQLAETSALQARLDDVVNQRQRIQDAVASAHLYQERLVAVRERLNVALPDEEVVVVYRDAASAIAASASQAVASSSWSEWWTWLVEKVRLRD